MIPKWTPQAVQNALVDLLLTKIGEKISGTVWREERPPQRGAYEDIVINTLPLDLSFMQSVSANVNAYVPMRKIRTDTGFHHAQNNARLDELTRLLYGALHEHYTPDFNCSIVWVQNMEEDTPDGGMYSFINCRVKLNLFNSYRVD